MATSDQSNIYIFAALGGITLVVAIMFVILFVLLVISIKNRKGTFRYIVKPIRSYSQLRVVYIVVRECPWINTYKNLLQPQSLLEFNVIDTKPVIYQPCIDQVYSGKKIGVKPS